MSQDLINYKVRVSKRDSSMLYFILESNENIAFYSTLKGEKTDDFRDIDINCHVSLKKQLDNILEHFSKKYSLTYLN